MKNIDKNEHDSLSFKEESHELSEKHIARKKVNFYNVKMGEVILTKDA